MKEYQFTTNVGDYLVIWITGSTSTYIAEVTNSEPLRMKVQETGPYAYLKIEDYIILEQDTEQLQKDCREDTNIFLKSMQQKGIKVISGLKSLGVTDDQLHEILPQEDKQ